ncbi:hypothetical protein [Mesorhizobium sp.]|nr:hypothetical protein [Mesorhizobium sp.]
MAAVLRVWLAERAGQPADPLFPTQTGRMISRDALEHRLARYVEIAARNCPSLQRKRVTLHTLRHYLPRPTMSSSFDRNSKCLKNRDISCRNRPGHPT